MRVDHAARSLRAPCPKFSLRNLELTQQVAFSALARLQVLDPSFKAKNHETDEYAHCWPFFTMA